ncbi:E3 ubiquitin-protein ligase synoviolin-like isoform X10 [Rhea pennata]|uniref:E3 ubiquitin-protein ligase synoviolin-like isoform X10 n=1 Tax=Rhea pennata TaxID=8795 RepID=UPI002E26A3BD
MFRTAVMMASSLALTTAVVAHAYYLKHQFYPTVVYLTKSSPSMAVLYIQAFVLVFLLGKFMGKVFFGQLRAAEMEHLLERSWYAVTETCLAFTVFRDDFSPRFVALFTLLLFLKCFHWLAEDRVDFMERSPNISWLFHFRIVSLMFLLGVLDFLFVSHAYHSILTRGASVQLVFGFEYAILLTMVLTVFIKYVLHSVDLQNENPWDSKAVYMLYTELFTGFIKVLLYMAFMTIMIKVHTFPLFAIRPMYLAMRQFKKAVTDAIMSRRAIRNMNTLYPDATAEELQAVDNVCIICREEMVTGAKRLPCNHIFHTSCLRSWFQRQQTCPTCRMDVLRASLPAQPPAPPEQPEPAQQPPPQTPQVPQPPNFPQGILPPFPPGMFPFWPPVGPFPPVPGVQPANGAENAGAASSAASAGAARAGDAAATSEAAPAGTVPGLPFPPPWMGMPWPPLFGFPPMPVPPAGFAGLTEEELRAMEGHDRQNLEARLQCLQNIHTLLDAAMLQINQYLTVLATIGSPRPAPPQPPAAASSSSSRDAPAAEPTPLRAPDAASAPAAAAAPEPDSTASNAPVAEPLPPAPAETGGDADPDLPPLPPSSPPPPLPPPRGCNGATSPGPEDEPPAAPEDEPPAPREHEPPPPLPPAEPAPSDPPDFERFWRAARDNPHDFTAWTELLQYVEQENHIFAARKAFDAFFAHYPYCYGYWKKYADMERRFDFAKETEEVFERGLQSIPLSMDLWIHYVSYLQSTLDMNLPESIQKIRGVFESAVAAAGMDFRSDKLWELYVEWEREQGDLRAITGIYDRVLSMPTQLYNHHWEKFKEHVMQNPPKDILSPEELLWVQSKLATETVPKPPEPEEAEAPPGEDLPPGVETKPDGGDDAEEDLDQKIRELVISMRQQIYTQNEAEVSKRWNFEEGIKRPYFHVKPLERAQLKNWRDYLDYEMAAGSHERTIVLFERCVIACALYEEFWVKRVQEIQKRGVLTPFLTTPGTWRTTPWRGLGASSSEPAATTCLGSPISTSCGRLSRRSKGTWRKRAASCAASRRWCRAWPWCGCAA